MTSAATSSSTLVLSRRDVSRLLDMRECIAAVERVFALHAAGATIVPGVLGSRVAGWGFHVKTAGLLGGEHVFVAKVNANFPNNPSVFSACRSAARSRAEASGGTRKPLSIQVAWKRYDGLMRR
jgi:hypothetical protein